MARAETTGRRLIKLAWPGTGPTQLCVTPNHAPEIVSAWPRGAPGGARSYGRLGAIVSRHLRSSRL